MWHKGARLGLGMVSCLLMVGCGQAIDDVLPQTTSSEDDASQTEPTDETVSSGGDTGDNAGGVSTGSDTNKVVIQDTSGNVLAYFLYASTNPGESPRNNIAVLFPSTGLIASIDPFTGQFAKSEIDYTGANCGGTAYAGSYTVIMKNRIIKNGSATFLKINGTNSSTVSLCSRRGWDGTCTNAPDDDSDGNPDCNSQDAGTLGTLESVTSTPSDLSSVAPIQLQVGN
jgi:hypothetical protein